MSNVLLGADSSLPQPTQYKGKKIWCVYVAGDTPHVWDTAEVAALASDGVEGVLPIVVPIQSEQWWLQNHGYAELESLVRLAKVWGVPDGSPLCLDIESNQAIAMGAGASDVAHAWAVATRTHGLVPWCYSSAGYLDTDQWSNKWLAEWPDVTPTDPVVPHGYRGWQYRGGVNGIDLDVFLAGEVFMSPELKTVTVDITTDVVTPDSPVTVSVSPSGSVTGTTSEETLTSLRSVAQSLTNLALRNNSDHEEIKAAQVIVSALLAKLETNVEVPKS
jgi:hypothetical protein